jgi:hypothetical protein
MVDPVLPETIAKKQFCTDERTFREVREQST